jgi:hypothetical protein
MLFDPPDASEELLDGFLAKSAAGKRRQPGRLHLDRAQGIRRNFSLNHCEKDRLNGPISASDKGREHLPDKE